MKYTFKDLLMWTESDSIELIDGEIFKMASPSRIHQEISMELCRQLSNYLKGRTCQVYAVPFAVRLFEQDGDAPEDVDTVVQPDISVICDPRKLDDSGCKGAPDMIIEILSPSNRRYDRIVKMQLYRRAGVKEYWVVNPEEPTVQVNLLDNGYMVAIEEYGKGQTVKVASLEDCTIDLSDVFADKS